MHRSEKYLGFFKKHISDYSQWAKLYFIYEIKRERALCYIIKKIF